MLFPIVLGSGKRLFTDSDNAKHYRLTSTTQVGDGIAVLTQTPVHDQAIDDALAGYLAVLGAARRRQDVHPATSDAAGDHEALWAG